MKAIIFFFLFTVLAAPTAFAQIKIGDNPQNIDASSVLELESTSKVLVITRVTTAEMEAITPQRGGMVYNTDTECINYYDGTQWVNLCDAVDFSITNDPIINGRSTIEITDTAGSINLEVAKNSILGDNIIDGGIGPDDIQDNSISQDKLAAESVGSSELRQNAVGAEEIRDGSITPADIANFTPGQVLTTDENGIVQWEDSDGLYDLTFNKLDTTLTIARSTIAGVSTISLGALIGSDDQQLDLTDNILSIENGENTIDLSTYFQTLSIDNTTNEITLSNGNSIPLPAAAVEADGIVGNEILDATDGTLVRNGEGTNANPYTIDVKAGGIDTTELANNSVTTAKIANNAVTTADILNGTILPEDIAPSAAAPANAQILSTSTTGVVGWINIPEGTAEVDGDISNELQDLNFNPATNVLTISTPLTAGNQVNLSGLANGGALNDGQIFVGNATNTPTGVNVGGDLTMNNIGQYQIIDNTIESANIINNTITLEDLNRNGATDGQVIKWDATLNAGVGAWTVANDIANGTGSNVTDTDANDGLSNYSNTLGYNVIVDDTTIEILGDALQVKEDAIGLDQLNPMGATTNGQVLKWNQDNTEWELGTDATGSAVTDIDPNDALTDFNATTGYNIKVDDTTIEILGDALQVKEDAIGLDQLNPMGADTNGQILKWNETTLAWELGTDVGGTLLEGQVLIGNAADEATPQTITGDATISNSGIITIEEDAIDNTMIAADVAGNGLVQNGISGALDIIPGTAANQILKWNNTTSIWELGTDLGGTLLEGQVLIGNAADEATPQTITGDATISNSGVITIEEDAIDNTMIAADVAGNGLVQNGISGALDIIPGTAANQILKWNNTTSIWELGTDLGGTLLEGQVLIGNAADEATPQTITGDATISNSGIITIEEDAIDNTMIAADVAGNGLVQNGISGALDIIPGTAANQILKWNNTTSIWELGTDATGSAVVDAEVNDGLTDFNTSTGYSIKVDDSTIEIVGDNLQVKGSTVNGQVLQTVGGDATWQNLTDDTTTGSLLFSDGNGGITENNNQLLWDETNNRFAIGNLPGAPQSKLDVDGQIQARGGFASTSGSAGNPGYGFYTNDNTNLGMYRIAEDLLGFSTSGTEAMRINATGDVGIGIAPTSKLHVAGDIRAEGAITASGPITTVPDYVFQKYFLGNSILNPNYKFNDLAEIEAFVKENNHLPGIQSAAAVKEQGFWNVSESSRVNLEKIEELFLHTIEQEKKIKELQSANTNMSTELEELKAQMAEIKTMLLEKQKN
ncbi:beta strand repeat-containing protein [Maribacter sp. R86514]|uniref:beta strand repeat-containing protein n=1 Tax=Maribacter sp. R86514 TaxID=3093854 RepID=UPI0037C98B20